MIHGAAGEEGGPSLFLSVTPTHSRTFRHFFATLHVRWLSRFFNRTGCNYQTAIWLDLPPSWITIWLVDDALLMLQKQPSRDVLIKRYSENMQQIYRRTPMLKLQSNFIEITLRHGCSPVNLLHIFRTSFPKNTSGGLLLMLAFVDLIRWFCTFLQQFWQGKWVDFSTKWFHKPSI